MNILLKTRCDCMRGLEISGDTPPKRVVVSLSDNIELKLDGPPYIQTLQSRTFIFVGTQKGTDMPIYLESIDKEPGFTTPDPLATQVCRG